MDIKKSTANKLRKGMLLRDFTYQSIADKCEVKRETVRMWVKNRRIPDKYVRKVEYLTGIEIR